MPERIDFMHPPRERFAEPMTVAEDEVSRRTSLLRGRH
jgi:hypothetical protein